MKVTVPVEIEISKSDLANISKAVSSQVSLILQNDDVVRELASKAITARVTDYIGDFNIYDDEENCKIIDASIRPLIKEWITINKDLVISEIGDQIKRSLLDSVEEILDGIK